MSSARGLDDQLQQKLSNIGLDQQLETGVLEVWLNYVTPRIRYYGPVESMKSGIYEQ